MIPATDEQTAALPVTVIAPAGGGGRLRLGELWAYRELLYYLTLRDVQIRYKQAVLGVAWALLQPVLTMLVFAFLFGRVARLTPEQGLPYHLYILVALLPWQLFAGALARTSGSLVGSANLLTKVYFPRLIIPLSAVAAALVDFLWSLLVLAVMLPWYALRGDWHPVVGWPLLLLPVFVLLALLAALAVGLWLSALNVQFRDVQYLVPFLVQIWLFVSPVAYAPSHIASPLGQALLALNPMTGVIQGFRWALLGTAPPDARMAVSVGMMLVLLVGGLFYFRRMERRFADVV
jgi:lipopolysaccharide transport system permease protein